MAAGLYMASNIPCDHHHDGRNINSEQGCSPVLGSQEHLTFMKKGFNWAKKKEQGKLPKSRSTRTWPNLVENFRKWRGINQYNLENAQYHSICRLFVYFLVRMHFWAAATIEKVLWKNGNQFRSQIVVVVLQCWRCGSLQGFKQTIANFNPFSS